MEDGILFESVDMAPQVEDRVQIRRIFLPLRYEALRQLDERLELILDPETAIAHNLVPNNRLENLNILFRKEALQEDLAQKAHQALVVQELFQLDVFEGLP